MHTGAAMSCRSLSLLLGLRQLQGLVLRDQQQAGIWDGLDAVGIGITTVSNHIKSKC